jgi:hypothetical protein
MTRLEKSFATSEDLEKWAKLSPARAVRVIDELVKQLDQRAAALEARARGVRSWIEELKAERFVLFVKALEEAAREDGERTAWDRVRDVEAMLRDVGGKS